jgi:tetratricopeptide (TPR) repeat protein
LCGSLLGCQEPNDPVVRAREAVAAAVTAHGDDSLEAAEQRMKLFQVLRGPGSQQEALALMENVVAIRRQKLPVGHQRTGIALSNLGSVRLQLGDLAGADAELTAAHTILVGGPTSRALLGVLTNLGACANQRGDYARAAQHLEAAVAYGEQHFADHPFQALALQNLAQVCINLGEIEVARRHVERTVAILARAEPDGARHAHALFGLGFTLMHGERPAEAMPLFERALALRAKLHGPNSAEVGDVEAAMGHVARRAGDLAAARRHCERALALAAPASTARRFRQATLARVLVAAGELETAAALLAAVDADAPANVDANVDAAAADRGGAAAAVRFARAELHAARGDHAQAGKGWRAVLRADADDPLLAFRARSELAHCCLKLGERGEAMPLLEQNVAAFDGVMAMVLPALLEDERLRTTATWRRDFDALLACTVGDAATTAAAYGAVVAWKGRVARGVQRSFAAARVEPADLARLRRLQQITSELAAGRGDDALAAERQRLLATMPPPSEHARPDAAAIQAVLGAGEALVDFVLWSDGAGSQFSAFVVRRDGVQRFELGSAAPLAQAVDSHLLVTSRSVRSGSAALARPAAVAARERIFAPLTPALAGATKLWLCPDGALSVLPFETLPGAADGTFLVEEVAITYLQDAAQLLAPAALPANEPHLLAFGDIDFGREPAAIAALRGGPRPFAPLPATAAELTAIAASCGAIPCTLLRRGEASEAALRERAGTATWLHLATHGFFGHGPGAGSIEAGIAMAGANDPGGGDDGIVTADEVALLDLRGCRLVVLSACQTALGQPMAGESLLGLRRSLRLAGVRACIASLWRIDDAATAALMGDFYGGLFAPAATPALALRAAQLRALARARQTSGEGLPGLWGAFVCDGAG